MKWSCFGRIRIMKGEGHSHDASPGNSGMYVVATMIIALGRLSQGGGNVVCPLAPGDGEVGDLAAT